MSEQGDKNKQLSPTICMLPVSSIAIHATGKMVRCHMSETEMGDVNNGSILKQWDNQAFQDLRKGQRAGEWVPGCQNCKTKESRGVTSKRIHWQNLDVIDDRWEDIDWDNNLTGNKLVHLDIAFNNLCNFKCRMCSSAYSNAWLGDEEKLKKRGIGAGGAGSPYVRTSSLFDRTKHTLSTEQLQELVDNGKDLRRVEILGGEPFLVPQFMEFLSMLRAAGLDKQIELMITTNGSVITEKHLEALEGFKYVNINLSLDASGDLFSYIRSAGIIDWAGITKKAELIKNWCDKPRTGVYKMNLNGTFMSINALNIKDFIEWIFKFYGWDKERPENTSKNRHSFEHRILVGPRTMHVQWLNEETLKKCLAQIDYLFETYDFLRKTNGVPPITEHRYLKDIRNLVEGLIANPVIPVGAAKIGPQEFAKYTIELDDIRGVTLKQVAPEIYESFKPYFDEYIGSKTSNFCHMPWHGLAVTANGNIKPCCQWSGSIGSAKKDSIVEQFVNSPKIIKLREAFLNNEKPEECNSCWERESQIGKSRRQWFKDKFETSYPKNYDYSVPVTENSLKWLQMDINLSNVCNLKCRMCGSWASNQWFEEDTILSKINPAFKKENNPERQKIVQHEMADLEELIPYAKKLQRIDFKGGEPMLAKNHVEFLEKLIENDIHEYVTLQYTTNGTVVNPRILDTFKHFKKVRLMFSIEGTGELYSYIRGGKFTIEQLEETIAMYDQLPNVHIGFNVTIQGYNLLNLRTLYKQLEEWSKKYKSVSNAQAFTTICNDPIYLSPFVLPKELRAQAKAQLVGIEDFTTLSRNLDSDDIHNAHWDTFKHFTDEVDKLRSESILDVVPEFKDYWK